MVIEQTLIARARELLHPLILPLIGWSYGVALAQSWGLPLHNWGLLASTGGIYAAYAWDRLLDDRRAHGRISAVRVVHLVMGAGFLILAVLAHSPLWLPVTALAGLGLFYIPLKRFIPKNLLTAAAWTLTLVVLPFDALPTGAAAQWGAAAVFLTIYAAATLCDVPDVAEDVRAGVRGLTTLLGGVAAARVAGGIALVGAMLAGASGVWVAAVPALACAALGFSAGDWLSRSPSGQFWVDALLVIPGLLVLLRIA